MRLLTAPPIGFALCAALALAGPEPTARAAGAAAPTVPSLPAPTMPTLPGPAGSQAAAAGGTRAAGVPAPPASDAPETAVGDNDGGGGGAAAGAADATPAHLDALTRSALARLPADTTLVASLEVGAARHTRLFHRVLGLVQADAELGARARSLRRQAGFDIRRHIRRVWLAVPAGALAQGGQRLAFLIDARVDPARFLAWLKKSYGAGLVERRVAGRRYYAADRTAWAFIDGHTLLYAHSDFIEDVLRAAAGQTPTALDNADLVRAAATAASPAAHAWLAVAIPPALKARLAGQPLTATMANLDWVAGRVSLGRTARFYGRVRAGDDRTAVALAAGLTQLSHMLGQGAAPGSLSEALGRLAVSSDHRDVELAATVGADAITAALDSLGAH